MSQLQLTAITTADRLSLTLFLAVAAHLMVVLGVGFVPEDKARAVNQSLDIVLVSRKSEKAPEKADFLAQASQEGGGEHTEKKRPATPLPSPVVGKRAVVVAAAPVPTALVKPGPQRSQPKPAKRSTPRPRAVLSTSKSSHKVQRTRPAKKPTSKPASKPAEEGSEQTVPVVQRRVSAEALVSRSMALASLSAELDKRLAAYANRPRRKWITSKTREYKYASYMDAWRSKVERVGNLNYPDEARRRRLSGHLLLDVALKPDGSIHTVTVRRSSGQRVLDDAALRIVRLAAPFAPFPKNIRKEVDILHIQRTWQFLNNNRLSAR